MLLLSIFTGIGQTQWYAGQLQTFSDGRRETSDSAETREKNQKNKSKRLLIDAVETVFDRNVTDDAPAEYKLQAMTEFQFVFDSD